MQQQKIELTAEQLSSFDQIISQKQSGAKVIGKVNVAKVANAVVAVAGAVVAVAKVVEVVGKKVDLTIDEFLNSSITDLVNNMPVEQLIEIRKNVIQKG